VVVVDVLLLVDKLPLAVVFAGGMLQLLSASPGYGFLPG
jgi:hypothetical protein